MSIELCWFMAGFCFSVAAYSLADKGKTWFAGFMLLGSIGWMLAGP